MSDSQTPGEIAYVNYGNAVNWENWQGQLMPRWPDLPGRIAAAWEAAARAVLAGAQP